MSRAVERLETRGLVRREQCRVDRRGAFATLTEAGGDLVRAAGVTHAAGIRHSFLERLTEEERRSLASVWERVLAGRDRPGSCGMAPGTETSVVQMSKHAYSPAQMHAFNQRLIDEFRANGGKLGGMFAGIPLLLLTTVGAKSGQHRIVPLTYGNDENRLVVIAAKRGSPTHPDWYHNLVANPEVTVEVGDEVFAARARVAAGTERQRLFDHMAETTPNFAEYQRNVTREIPVIVLERVGEKPTARPALNEVLGSTLETSGERNR